MLALNLPLAIRSSDERTENTCKFWILATFMWLCEMVGLQNVWDPATHALWWIGIFWLTAYQISLSTTEIDPEINFLHHLGHDVMRIAAILDMADALEVAHDTIALLLAPAVIAAVASNVIALMSHRMRKTDPAAVERLEAARQMRMEQAAQTLAEHSQAQPSSHPSGKTAPAYSRHPMPAYQAVTSKDTFKLTKATRATKTFKDVVGMNELKTRLLDAGKDIVESYTNRAVGEARNGILLVGTPGNGKTMFAEALAGELKLPMIYSSMGKIASRYLNQTTEQFMDLMASAALQAPCLLMIDEIDSMLFDRTNIDESTVGGKDAWCW
jgi:DNA replication protein DnaC